MTTTKQARPGRPTKREERIKEKRQRREGVSADRRRLVAEAPEGMTARWVNDEGDRIAAFRNRGWEFIAPDGSSVEDQGSCKCVRVGKTDNGAALFAYLMGIETELLEEDRAAKQAENDTIMEQIEGKRIIETAGSPDVSAEHASAYVKQADITTSLG